MKNNPIKIINILMILFALVSIVLCISFIVSANNTYSIYVNNEGANEISEMLKQDDNSSDITKDDVSRYEHLLNNNGYNLSDLIMLYSNAAIWLSKAVCIFGILLNLLVIIFAIVVIRRSANETLIFFTTKFSVLTLILSVLTINPINIILSIISIVLIRKKMFE